MPFRMFLTAVAVLLLLPLSAAAQEDGARDEVILSLSEEIWVEANDARLMIGIETAVPADGIEAAQKRIDETLKFMDGDADWRITRFSRNPDPTGLERWQVAAEARVTAGILGDIRGEAEELSTAGFKVTVKVIDFTPSPAAFEHARAQLRKKIYVAAKAELGRIDEIFPERDFRLAEIDFLQGPEVMPHLGQKRVMAAQAQFEAVQARPASVGARGAEMAVSQRLTMAATVVLAAGE